VKLAEMPETPVVPACNTSSTDRALELAGRPPQPAGLTRDLPERTVRAVRAHHGAAHDRPDRAALADNPLVPLARRSVGPRLLRRIAVRDADARPPVMTERNRRHGGDIMNRPWLQHYPPGVAAEIDTTLYPSLVAMFEESFQAHRGKDAFAFMGKTLTYGELDEASRPSPPGCKARASSAATASPS
jgi:hypothetical protein